MGWHWSLLVAMLEDYWRPCPTGYGSGYGYDSVSLMSFAVSHSIIAGHRTGLLSLLSRQKRYPQPSVTSKHTFRLSDSLINQINPCSEIIREKNQNLSSTQEILSILRYPKVYYNAMIRHLFLSGRQIDLFHSLPH